MDTETLKWVASFAAPAAIGLWLWYKERKNANTAYSQKTADDTMAYDRKRIDTGQALGSDLSKQLLSHIITLTDGQFSNLRDIVTKGFENIALAISVGFREVTLLVTRNNQEQEDRDKQIIAALNQLIVFLSRNQASLPVIGHVENWADVEEIKAASITSAAVQKQGALVDASTANDMPLTTVEPGHQVIAVVEAKEVNK